jgi:hypothetical protein
VTVVDDSRAMANRKERWKNRRSKILRAMKSEIARVKQIKGLKLVSISYVHHRQMSTARKSYPALTKQQRPPYSLARVSFVFSASWWKILLTLRRNCLGKKPKPASTQPTWVNAKLNWERMKPKSENAQNLPG